MKCEQCRTLIEDCVDGELEPSKAAQVGAHLGACINCASLAAGIRQEQELYSRYERDVEVTPALWSNIRVRIQEERREKPRGVLARVRGWLAQGHSAPRLSPALAAELVVATIGITVGVMTYLHSRDHSPTQVASNPASTPSSGPGADSSSAQPNNDATANGEERPSPKPAPETGTSRVAVRRSPSASPDPDQLVREAEQKYVAAIRILSRGLKDRREQLDPGTRARFDIALAEIDQTIYATRQAVHKNPNDPIAIGYMLTAYSKKVDFLRDTAREDTEANRPF